jgi:hypothetical protein
LFKYFSEDIVKTMLVRSLGLAALTTHIGLASAIMLSGCAGSPETATAEIAAAGADDVDTEADSESMAQSFVGGDSETLSLQSVGALNPSVGAGGLHAEGIVSNPAGGFFQPAGCLSEVSDLATQTNTYTFSDCTGPFGLVHLTGVVTVVWSQASADTLNLELSSKNFEINRATVTSWNATAAIKADGDSRTMQWAASLTGTTKSGRAFSRTNAKTISWTVGGSCISISGSSQGTITGLDLDTTITNYSRCEGSCPAAGSEVHIEDVKNGESIDLKYLGGDSAQFTSVDGTVTDLPLFCQ